MDTSQFSNRQSRFDAIEQMNTRGATCDTFRVKLYGKLHFLKRLKFELSGDIRYREALRKEFETGYQLEHPHLVRYLSLDGDSILMEYVDGESLSQRLASNPAYFKNRKNTDKFIRQLLDVVGYLHSHQVLHLDLKPDNILLTRINDDVKLIDLGCCYTDSFPDTTGHTNAFAAPEQLSNLRSPKGRLLPAGRKNSQLSIQTDIYAIGRILERLPDHTKYNKVIARCTAERPADRYQSVEEITNALRHKPRFWYILATLVIALALVASLWTLFLRQLPPSAPVIQEVQTDSVTIKPKDTLLQEPAIPVSTPKQKVQKRDDKQQMEIELDRLMDAAYHATIATFCDSVFPSLTVGRQWESQSSEFHTQSLQIAADVSKKYPDIPENVIAQHAESRFQSLVSYVFNKMRENGKNQ